MASLKYCLRLKIFQERQNHSLLAYNLNGEVLFYFKDTAKMHTSSLLLGETLLSGLCAGYSKSWGMSKTQPVLFSSEHVCISSSHLNVNSIFSWLTSVPKGTSISQAEVNHANAPASHLIQSTSGMTWERTVTAILKLSKHWSIPTLQLAHGFGLCRAAHVKKLSKSLSL